MVPPAGRKRPYTLALVLLLGIAILIRFVYLHADTPHWVGAWWLNDEGWWVRNARNRALFGVWSFGDFGQGLTGAPVFTLASYLSFHWLGLGLGQARMSSATAGAGTLLLLFWWLRRQWTNWDALLATLALGLSYVFFLHNRLATPESLVAFWLTVAALAWSRGEENRLAYVFSGLATMLAIGSKVTAVFFLAVPLFVAMSHHRPDRRALLRPLTFFYLSAAIPLAVALWVTHPDGARIIRFFVAFSKTQGAMSPLRLPTYLAGFLMLPAFADIAVLWTLCILFFARWRKGGQALGEYRVERFAAAWLLCGLAFLAFLDHFWRHAAILMPPIAVLAVSYLRNTRSMDFEDAPSKFTRLLLLYPPLLIAMQGLYPLIEPASRRLNVGRVAGLGPEAQGAIALLLASVLAALLLARRVHLPERVYPGAAALWAAQATLLAGLFWRLGWVAGVQGRLLPVVNPGAVALLGTGLAGAALWRWKPVRARAAFAWRGWWVVAFLLINVPPLAGYFAAPTFTVANVGQRVAGYVAPGTVVTGGRADTVLLPTPVRVIWEPSREKGWSSYTGPPPSETLLVTVPWNHEPQRTLSAGALVAGFAIWPAAVPGRESSVQLVRGRLE
ncbi:MAG: hypothetical protein GXP41_08510 [Chloroflexi bacterium]|nr:hypothetical protein [Chloroflexota bacterium]